MNKQLSAYVREYFKFHFALVAAFAFPSFFPASGLYAQEELPPKDPQVKITFEDRLTFYLDQKSKTFLSDLAVKEKLLLQMIQNITEELRKRGRSSVLDDEIGYQQLYGEADKLIEEYGEELNLLVGVLREIAHLEKVVDQSGDLYSWDRLANLRGRVLTILENRDLYKKGKYTEARVKGLFHEYHSEVDSVLSLYKRLVKLERKAEERGDWQIQQAIAAQLDSINIVLGNFNASETDTLSEYYLDEVELLVAVLDELKDLQKRAIHLDTELSIEIEELRRSILQNLDAQLLSLMGYHSTLPDDGPTVSEFFKEWKAKQYADHKIHFTQYQIMKRSLLESSTPEERSRMLEKDLLRAFLNYVEKNYELAEKQFDLILADYGQYFESLESVLFYRAESFFVRDLYDQAANNYERIVAEFPDSEYLGDSLFRLMLIHEKFGNRAEFYKYFGLLKSLTHNLDRSYYDKCNYLAGHVYFKDSKFSDAQEVLSNVSKGSKYYLMARYLLGLVFVNQENYASAAEILQDLASRENYPWTDPRTTFIRNKALLKLGFLNYELRKYEKASKYFGLVSPGFEEYDKALLGSAWTNLKLGKYEQTIENVNRFFKDYLASNYTYEALVLSAHSKKLLKRDDSALQDLRYVANARRVLELSDKYNAERKELLDQLATLDKLEEEILERRDEHLYTITSQIRDHLQNMLVQFKSRGSTGVVVLEKYEDERRSIIDQIDELDHLISQAFSKGNKDLVNNANRQRMRLLRALEVYQADKAVRNVHYFMDYPLATKEGSLKYRKGILSDLFKDAQLESQNIQNKLQEIQFLKSKLEDDTTDLSAKMDLQILEDELERLQNQSTQFHSWLAENQIEELNTDFDQWADFSGFGMSDITFSGMIEREETVLELAQNRDAITRILQERKSTLEKKLSDFEKEVERIEEELRQEQIELEKESKEEYFKELYFDTNEREVEEKEAQSAPPDSLRKN